MHARHSYIVSLPVARPMATCHVINLPSSIIDPSLFFPNMTFTKPLILLEIQLIEN